MTNSKIDRIDREIQKVREKIIDSQNKLKELETLKMEQENLQIVQLVRSLRMSPQELKAFLSGDTAQKEQATVTPIPATNYYDTQEDSEDEE